MIAFGRRPSKEPTRRTRASARVPMNYYRSKAQVPAAKPRTKSSGLLKRVMQRTTEIIILVIVVLVLGYSLIVSPQPKVEISSNLFHDSQTYTKSLEAMLNSLKNRNKISFDSGEITRKLQQAYPEIISADIHLPLVSQRPIVKLTIAQPSFKLVSDGRTYLVGNQGLVITDASRLTAGKALPVLDDKSGYKVEIGKPALDLTGVNFINQLMAQLKKAKIPVKGLLLPARAQEMELTTKDRGYLVKFYLGGDPKTEIGQYLATRHYLDKQHIHPARYLDVRVPGKIFYR